VVAVCGLKKVGKTTLLTNLIPLLRQRGLKIAVIKHDGHDFEPDVPGTDSYKLRAAGAQGVAVYSAARWLVTKEAVGLTAADLLGHFSDSDLILLEGGKNSPYPKIEIFRQGGAREPVSSPPHLAFCVEGSLSPTGAPLVGLTDYSHLVDLIIDRLLS
jgi:molybdopterin-guanine dinucleotide biosynthesis protein B